MGITTDHCSRRRILCKACLLPMLLLFVAQSHVFADGTPVFNVRDYDAAGNGKALDKEALNKAVSECAKAGGGQVLVPPGTYLSGTIHLKSNVTLKLDAGARILGTEDLDQYDHYAPPEGTPEAGKHRWHRALVLATNVENVTITGSGTIDGNKVFDAKGEEDMRGPHTIIVGSSQDVTIRDVTRTHRHQQRLAVLNRVLRHDLRNDLNVVQGHAEFIAADPSVAEESAAIIGSKATRLVGLATKVREAERTLGRADRLVTDVDVVELVTERVTEARREQPFAEFVLRVPDDPATVRSSDLLGLAVDNLLENAVVHTTSLSPTVEVTVRRDEETGTVEVSVADDGPGIPRQEREVLVDGQETPLDHGSGIGLWLVNWIVSESMGTVSFGENDPTGSVVTLRLPLAGSTE